jgi:hypothetical protein
MCFDNFYCDKYTCSKASMHARSSVLVTVKIVKVRIRIKTYSSGVTTMGSDRENLGAPNPNGPNGGPQVRNIEQKHWPGPLICYNVVF